MHCMNWCIQVLTWNPMDIHCSVRSINRKYLLLGVIIWPWPLYLFFLFCTNLWFVYAWLPMNSSLQAKCPIAVYFSSSTTKFWTLSWQRDNAYGTNVTMYWFQTPSFSVLSEEVSIICVLSVFSMLK